ncbi:MAG TPA: hypothetical protein VI072_06835 [Polyangiaceae bacterium]
MNADHLDRYRRLMNELLIFREAEGGELPVEVESAYVERLDDLWWQLSEEEQAAYEIELTNALPPGSPDDLELVDCEVNEGEHAGPRKAA